MAEARPTEAQVTVPPRVRILAANLVVSLDIDGIQQTFLFPQVGNPAIEQFRQAVEQFPDGNDGAREAWKTVVEIWNGYWNEQAMRRAIRG